MSTSDAPRVRKYSRYSAQPVFVNPLLQNLFRIRHSEISGSSIILVPPRDKRRFQQSRTLENVLKKSTKSGELEDLANRPLVLDSQHFYRRTTTRITRPSTRAEALALGSTRHLGRTTQSRLTCSYQLDGWASMFATQPPLEILNLRCDLAGGQFGAIKVLAKDNMGIRLSDIIETAADFYRTGGPQSKYGFRFDAEMSIYQPVDVERSQNGSLAYFTDGQLNKADSDQAVGFQRAWKTKLRCNLG